MKRGVFIGWLLWCLSVVWISPALAEPVSSARNLVENAGFEISGPDGKTPAGWTTSSPRTEIAPSFETDDSVSHSGKRSVRASARGNPGTFGFWAKTVQGIQEGIPPEEFELSALTLRGADFLSHKAYRVGCFFKAQGIEDPARNIWIRVNWLDGKGQEVFTQYLSPFRKEGEWHRVEEVLTAPLPARSLQLELVLQWTAGGSVWWDDVSVVEVPAPSPRRIKLAAISYQPPGRTTPEENLRFYAEKIAAAGKLGVDLLCLGEGVTLVSTGKKYAEVAEPIPGPTSRGLGEAARKSRLYVVAGIYEREGSLIYNTALLIDRNGNLAGKYRKTHLPETEVNGGLMPGDSYPVFQTDFGKVGIEICYDHFFPEVARSLALNGAEIILLPIWGDLRGQDYAWDIVARARAIDNAVFLVASIYSNRRSLIINPDGRVLADTGREEGLVTAEVDLNARTFERWLSVGSYGEWKNLFPQERRTESYQVLTSKPGE